MPKTPKFKKSSNNPLIALAKISGMGIQMGLIIYAGNQLGLRLDQLFSVFFLETTLTLLAVAIAIYTMVRQAKTLL